MRGLLYKAAVIALTTTVTAITKEQLEDIAPKTSSCTDAKYADECATSEVAAKQLTTAIEEHKLSASESAAVIAWQLNESLEYRYNINHFSNGQEKHNPGQGSRCMANSQFIAAYVAAHDDLRTQSPVELEANATPASITGMNISDEDKDKILDLVLDDAHSWDVAFWFYDSQCTESVKGQLKDGGLDAFMQQCVGGPTPEKIYNYYEKLSDVL